MPNWAWFLAGVAAVHVGWALVFIAVWWRTIRRVPPAQRRTVTRQDFQDVRDAILHRHANERN